MLEWSRKEDFRVGTLPIPSDCLDYTLKLAAFNEWRIYSQQPLVAPFPAFHDGIEPRFVWDDLYIVPLLDGHEVHDSITVTIQVMRREPEGPPTDEIDEARRWAWSVDFGEIDASTAAYHDMVRARGLSALCFVTPDGYAEAIVNAPDLSQFDLFRTAYLWLTHVVKPHQAVAEYANWTPSDIEDQVLKELRMASTVLDSECVRYLARHPEALPEVHPRKFESLVASVLRSQGYDVQLTPQSWDGGKDLFVLSVDTLGPILTLVECKQYDGKRHVGVREVREILGVASIENAPRVAIVTTSSFTSGAQRLAASQNGRLSLVDGAELARWLKDAATWRMGAYPGLLQPPMSETEPRTH
jgi:hypothetical protein